MIHKYKLGAYNVVLDVNSGGVHLVDDLTYDLLDHVAPPFEAVCPAPVVELLSKYYSKEDIASCYEEIVSLYENAMLFSSDEEYKKFTNLSVASPIKAMCLNVAHDCNLRCTYCFASTGDFGEGRKLMTPETGRKAIDFLIAHSANRKQLEMDFFGGEPTMNFDTVKEIVAYARSREQECGKKFRFTLTTNGTLLTDDKIDFLNREMSNVVLSIDGRRETNDRMRPYAGGKGSYDRILPAYQKLVAQRGEKEYYVRGTFTKYNLDFTDDVFSLYEAGFDQISIEPVVAEPDKPYALTEADLPAIYKEYERLMYAIFEAEKQGKRFNFFHFMIDLDQGPCVIKRLRGCGCGNEYVAVTPDGDIYPCHQFVGNPDFKMGNLDEGTFDQTMKKDFSCAHIYTKPECQECWARFYCSGGCNANNHSFRGDIRKPYRLSCEIEKKRLECAIVLRIMRMEEGLLNPTGGQTVIR